MTITRKRLLFVDDERAIRETLAAILRRYGFDVILAATVREALHYIATREFDLLLCDLNIEHRQDGFDVIRALRTTNPNCVVFILTGDPTIGSFIEGTQVGVDDYITKPANADSLVAALAEKLVNEKTDNTVSPLATPIGVERQSGIKQQ